MANRDDLRGFLTEKAVKGVDVDALMATMEPFFQIAESGVCPLKPAGELDAKSVAKVIATATNTEVTRVEFVSQANPFPKPGWMTEAVYREAIKAGIWDSIGTSLEDIFWDILEAGFRDSIEDSLWDSIRAGFGDSIEDSFGVILWAIWTGLFCYFGYGIINNQKVVIRLKPLVDLLPSAIPLGVKKDEPGVWLVLTV